MPKRKQTLKEKIAQRKREEEIVGIKRGVGKKSKKFSYDFPARRKPFESKKDERKWDRIEETYPNAPAGLRRRVYNNYYDRKYGKTYGKK